MPLTWLRVGPGHYASGIDKGAWEVRREPGHSECAGIINPPIYRIIDWAGKDIGGRKSLRTALLDAGYMFASGEEAREASRGPIENMSDIISRMPLLLAADRASILGRFKRRAT